MIQGKINRDRHTNRPAGATPSGLTSAHLHHTPIFLHVGCPSCRPTNSVKALKATQVPFQKCIQQAVENFPSPTSTSGTGLLSVDPDPLQIQSSCSLW